MIWMPIPKMVMCVNNWQFGVEYRLPWRVGQPAFIRGWIRPNRVIWLDLVMRRDPPMHPGRRSTIHPARANFRLSMRGDRLPSLFFPQACSITLHFQRHSACPPRGLCAEKGSTINRGQQTQRDQGWGPSGGVRLLGQGAIVVAALALVLLTWFGVRDAIQAHRSEAIARVQAEVLGKTLAFEEQLRRELLSIDQTLRILEHEWQRDPAHFDLAARFGQAVVLGDVSLQLFIADAQGIVRSSSRAAIIGTDVSRRDYFRHEAAADGRRRHDVRGRAHAGAGDPGMADQPGPPSG